MSQFISRAYQVIHEDDPAVAIRLRTKDLLPDLKIGGADLLIGVWVPDKEAKTTGGILLPDGVRQEFRFQGVTGLILKMGPSAYNTPHTRNWFVDEAGEPDPPKVGEWVSFNFKQGESFYLVDQPCRLVNDQYVLMRISRPDVIA